MKKSKFKLKPCLVALATAVCMLKSLPVEAQFQKIDGFFNSIYDDGYGDRAYADIDVSVTTDPFGAPLENGLLIMGAAAIFYAGFKSKNNLNK